MGLEVRMLNPHENTARELALAAREVADPPAFRREALAACSHLVPYDTAVFSGGGPAELTTVAVDNQALAFIHHCQRNFVRYMPELGKALAAAEREGGIL